MRRMLFLAALLALPLLLISSALSQRVTHHPSRFTSQASRATQQIQFAPYEMTGAGGKKVPAEIGKLKVPENRSKPDSRFIELTVVRIRARSENPGSPVLYLAGGPGGSAINEAGLIAKILERLQENHDIVLMDQRGTGRS